ncbi:acrylate utilization transcriptional regulator AcuR [Epibacterium ulvae]|uniref:acrylate utilization transcriptional regulator AcuR n=1 Tax=Epibacterium ulvae TaxID=1156985 RepID=UPI0020412DE3|nr:TetR/AcrR family transcriptional regulator [Epibacterium ulvae]
MTSQPSPNAPSSPRRRGRPRRTPEASDVRNRLVRVGLEFLTEKGYGASSVDEILKTAGVPKGNFYHYFRSKSDFGITLIEAYDAYFLRKLDATFLNTDRPAIARVSDFAEDAIAGMARHDFKRGCLVGNLGQEMGTLPEAYRAKLTATFEGWQARLETCLRQAQSQGDLDAHKDPASLAAFFWIGWEGAVLRAKLERDPAPLRLFMTTFMTLLAP